MGRPTVLLLLLLLQLGFGQSVQILGTDYYENSGTRTSGTTITNFDKNDYLSYASVNFGESGMTKGILINHSKDNDNGKIEVRLGGTTGRVIAEFNPAKTGGWNTYRTAYVGLQVNDIEGVHDVTLLAKDSNGVLNLAWFELSDFSDRPGVNVNINPTTYSDQSGMRFNNEGRMISVDKENYITYSSLNFGSSGTTKGILMKHSKGDDNGRIEVRLGGTTGILIAEFSPAKTGGWDKFRTAYVGLLVDGIDAIEGVHDVTLLAKDDNSIFDLEWFELSDFEDRSGLYPNIAATAYSNQSGMRFDNDGNVINIDKDDYITYSSLNFGSSGATSSVKITYSKDNNGGSIEMRLNGPEGEIIGEFTPSRTGSWDVFEEEMVAIDHVDGVHDLTFVGKDTNGIMDMKSFELAGTTVYDSLMSSPTVSPKSMSTDEFSCVDSLLDVLVPGGKVGCSYLATNIGYCSYPGAGSHCPVTCNKCLEYQCADSELEFVYGENSYFCTVLKLVSEKDRQSYCDFEAVYSTCRASCEVCA